MKEDTSALVDEILTQFLEALKADQAVHKHTVELLQKHFLAKSSITPAELKTIFASNPDVS